MPLRNIEMAQTANGMEQSDQPESRPLWYSWKLFHFVAIFYTWLQDKQLEMLEKNLQMKSNAMEALTASLEENRDAENQLKTDLQDVVDPEQDKIVT